MHVNDRRDIILTKLQFEKSVDIDQLATEFSVSNMTIRRDLDYLQKKNKVIRTFGGAISASEIVKDVPLQVKENKYIAEKRMIAQKAVEEIHDNATILLDSGTTTLEIAKLLHKLENITVLTNDIMIAAILMDSSVTVILLGGELQKSTGAILGSLAESQLQQFRVDIAFIGAHAIDLEAGITVPSLEKAMLKRKMMHIAQKNILVADSSKFDKKSFMEVCMLSDVDKIITNDDQSKNYYVYEEFIAIEIS